MVRSVYDGRAIPVGGVRRIVFGTAKAAPKVGGPVRVAGQIFGRTRALRPPGVTYFSVRGPNGALGALLRPPVEMLLGQLQRADFPLFRSIWVVTRVQRADANRPTSVFSSATAQFRSKFEPDLRRRVGVVLSAFSKTFVCNVRKRWYSLI